MAEGKERWEKEAYEPFVRRSPERDVPYESLSGIPIEPLYTPEDLAGWRYEDNLGYPGEFQYTRGSHTSMYRGSSGPACSRAGRRGHQRAFGYSRPGTDHQHGLRHACLMGYDADQRAGEVSKEGVSIHPGRFRDPVPRHSIRSRTSMTINCTASVPGTPRPRRQAGRGYKVGGTMQNDMLKEFIARRNGSRRPNRRCAS
jgi:methylmalonyl-CoA mutase N-terminal domain/subunit